MAKNRYRRRPKRSVSMPALRTILLSLAGTILLGTLSTVLIFGHDLFTQCDYFQARQIKVTGNLRLSPAHVLDQAGLNRGVNILAVNLPLSRKRLLAHPWIAQAEVRREMPDTLVVTVREHQALAVIDLGKAFLVNQQGEIFKAWEANDPMQLPRIRGLNVADLALPGQANHTLFGAVMKVLAMGQEPNSVLPINEIQIIRVDREVGITLTAFNRRKQIDIGFEDYPAKFQRLRQVLNYMDRADDFRDFRWIDLNNVDRIVVHPVSPNPDAHKEA